MSEDQIGAPDPGRGTSGSQNPNTRSFVQNWGIPKVKSNYTTVSGGSHADADQEMCIMLCVGMHKRMSKLSRKLWTYSHPAGSGEL